MNKFFQDGPELSNTFHADSLLAKLLKRKISPQFIREIERDLERFGERCATDLMALANQAEAEPPRHIPFDAWGRRIDLIQVSPAWDQLHRVCASEGLIAIGYERKHGEFSRLYQFAKLYLFHPSSAIYTCPLAMTDGAARVIELHGSAEMKARAFRKLTSRDPNEFWTSGQWMTERTGGSDVSGTSTFARKEGGKFTLRGDKWFTSATTSQMAMALAKVEGETDARGGLSLFYVETRDNEGQLNHIQINRLKDKLGTKSLPTAELTLDGTPGTLVGEIGEGVKRVSSLLNITRLYNSVTAVGAMARGLQLAKDFARKRTVFGRKLENQPLHLQTLADLRCEFEAVMHLVFHLVHLLGREEVGTASPDDSAMLRLLTPVVKLWSAKQCMTLMSEVLESFGGAGYIEDTGLPRMLREAQVFSIWEGTTNVLSLDTLRAIGKDASLPIFLKDTEARIAKLTSSELSTSISHVEKNLAQLGHYFNSMQKLSSDEQQAGARAFAIGLAQISAASLVLEFADQEKTQEQYDLAKRFCRRELFKSVEPESLDADRLHRQVFGSPL